VSLCFGDLFFCLLRYIEVGVRFHLVTCCPGCRRGLAGHRRCNIFLQTVLHWA
jgi:hypothetical protein